MSLVTSRSSFCHMEPKGVKSYGFENWCFLPRKKAISLQVFVCEVQEFMWLLIQCLWPAACDPVSLSRCFSAWSENHLCCYLFIYKEKHIAYINNLWPMTGGGKRNCSQDPCWFHQKELRENFHRMCFWSHIFHTLWICQML